MSDFIREVDEEVRHDRFRDFWNRRWVSILAGVVLILVGVGAWRGYMTWRQGQAEAAGARFSDALELSRDDPKAALPAFEAIGRDGPAGYRLLARLRAAADLGRADPAAGAKAFDALAQDGALDAETQEVARLRAAILLVDSAAPDELRRRLEPLADSNATYRSPARELLAVAALKRGDAADARRWLDAITSDPAAPPDIRQRALAYLGLVHQDGAPAPP